MKTGDIVENVTTGVRALILSDTPDTIYIFSNEQSYCIGISRSIAMQTCRVVETAKQLEDPPKEKHYDLKVKIQPGNCGYILENNAVVKVDIARVFVAITTKGIEISYGTADEYSYYANKIFATKEELLASL